MRQPPAFDRIQRTLGATRRRLLARAGLITAGWGLALIAGLSLAALLMAAWLGSPALRGVALGLLALGVLAVFGRHFWRPWRRYRADAQVAEHLEAGLPTLKDGLRASVQFASQWPDVPGSPAMAAALAEQVADRLDDTPLAPITGFEAARRPWAIAGGALAAWGLVGVLFPGVLAQGWSALNPSAATAAGLRETGPLVGDLVLTLEFPAYTKRPAKVIPNSAGDLRAPKGTVVTVAATTLTPVTGATIRFGTGEAATEQALTLGQDGRDVQAKFVVERETTWRVAVTMPDGETLVEGLDRKIDLALDKAPEVVLQLPTEDLEMDDLRRLQVAFEARDDVALGSVNVVVALAADLEHPEKLSQPAVSGRRYQGEDEVDLTIVQAKPGDRLALFVEAFDTNDVDGPQRGVSATRYITVRSPQQKHYALTERLRALVDVLVDALADRLEAEFYAAGEPPLKARIATYRTRTDAAVEAFAGVVDEMVDDPLTPKEVRLALTGRLGSLQGAVEAEATALAALAPAVESGARAARDQANKRNEAVIEPLEQSVVLVEAMVARLALEDMAAIAEELQAARARLKDLIKQYKANPDDEALKARIMRDLKRLKQRIDEMRARMAQLRQKLPQEFLNLDGMQKDEVAKGLGETKNQLDELEKMLEEGKIDEALKAIEEMEQALDDLSASLNDDMNDLHAETNPEMQRALSELMDQTRDLMREQKSISDETEKLAQAESEAERKVLEEALKAKLDGIKAQSQALQKTVDALDPSTMSTPAADELSHLKARVEKLNGALERAQLLEALEMAGRSQDHLDRLDRQTRFDRRSKHQKPDIERGQKQAQDVEQALAELFSEARKQMQQQASQGQQQRQQLGEQQRALSEAARQLQQRMGEQGQKMPGLKPDTMDKAGKAAQAMQQASRQLQQGRPGQARPGQQQAMSELQGIMQGLKQANQPQRAERPGQQQRQSRQHSKEKVAIPDADDHQSPAAFRKDLLDAMKDQAPEQWKAPVKRYYESLVK